MPLSTTAQGLHALHRILKEVITPSPQEKGLSSPDSPAWLHDTMPVPVKVPAGKSYLAKETAFSARAYLYAAWSSME